MTRRFAAIALFVALVLPAFAGDEEKAAVLAASKKFFGLLAQAKPVEAAALASGDLKDEIKALVPATLTGVHFYFTELDVRKDETKVFVLTQFADGKIQLQKYYLRLEEGSWKPYRARTMPFLASVP